MTARKSPPLAEILRDPRLALMLALGFSSGLPFLLIFSTQSAWLREAGVSHTAIGLTSYAALAFSFKFAWAPIIDEYDPPLTGAWLGRRRGWMLLAQLGVAAGLLGSPSGRRKSLAWTVGFAFLTAFAAASQDVTIEAGASTPRRRAAGQMAAVYQLGYRLAMLCAGASTLYIADFVSWRAAYLAMAGADGRRRRRAACCRRHRSASAPPPTARGRAASPSSVRASRSRIYSSLSPDFRRHPRARAIYRLPDFVSGVMAHPLYIDLGFSKSDIATVSKLYRRVDWHRRRLRRRLLRRAAAGSRPRSSSAASAASASHLTLAWLAASGAKLELLTASVSAESFASGFAGAALIAFMSSLVSPAFAATQYALLSSLYALPGKLVGGLSGAMVEAFGYPRFFIATATIGIPVVALTLVVWRMQASKAPPGGGRAWLIG